MMSSILPYKATSTSCQRGFKQNPSYQISKHSNLCPKGCSSSFPRQIKIRQFGDYMLLSTVERQNFCVFERKY